MGTDIKVDRFFEDIDLKNLVSLTQVEAKVISDFERDYEYYNGLKSVSGGFACITLDDIDKDIIIGFLKSGIQNDCENNVCTDVIEFNRETLKVKIV